MTSVSKTAYIDKLDSTINKYMKPVDVKSNTYINSSKETNNKDPKSKIGNILLLKYQNIKIFLQRVKFQIGLKKFLLLKKLKTLCCGYILLVILKVEKLLERFLKNNCKNKSKRV